MNEFTLILFTAPVLMLELFALVKIVQKLRSPYAFVVSIAALFFVNISLYYAFIQFWITQTPTD